MTKRHQKRKSNSLSDDEVSITFPNQFVTTRPYLMTTAEAGQSSIRTTEHLTTTYGRQTPPVSIDEMPTRRTEGGEMPVPKSGTQVVFSVSQDFTLLTKSIFY